MTDSEKIIYIAEIGDSIKIKKCSAIVSSKKEDKMNKYLEEKKEERDAIFASLQNKFSNFHLYDENLDLNTVVLAYVAGMLSSSVDEFGKVILGDTEFEVISEEKYGESSESGNFLVFQYSSRAGFWKIRKIEKK